jgi:ParB/RepB/Spo0J family partition protein
MTVDERVVWLPLAQIDVPAATRRRTHAKLEQLKRSIAEHGQLNPVEVVEQENGRYRLHVGGGRYLAISMLGWERIWARVHDSASAADLHARQVVENDAREGLRPGERAHQYARQVELAGSVREAARQLGIHEKSLHRVLKRQRQREQGRSVKSSKVPLSTIRDRLEQLSDPSVTPHWQPEVRAGLVRACVAFLRRWEPEQAPGGSPYVEEAASAANAS